MTHYHCVEQLFFNSGILSEPLLDKQNLCEHLSKADLKAMNMWKISKVTYPVPGEALAAFNDVLYVRSSQNQQLRVSSLN